MRKLLTWAMAVWGIMCCNPAQGASFDCAKAGTKVEKMICANAEVSQLDGEMAMTYRYTLQTVADPASVKKEQRQWLKERNKCQDESCLIEKYRQRIGVMDMATSGYATIYPEDISEFDVDCDKPKGNIEKTICDGSLTEKLHKEMRNRLQWALMRSTDKQKKELRESQRLWQKNVRNICDNEYCLMNANEARTKELIDLQARLGQCYVPQPILDGDGKVEPIRPIYQAMEENLNQFCFQPPMVCELKVAPEFQKQITMPDWTPLDPKENYGLMEKLFRTPWLVNSKSDDLEKKIWQDDKAKIDAAMTAGTLTFSKGLVDLYNLGDAQETYRVDYGNCKSNNPYLDNPESWGVSLKLNQVNIQHSPEVIKTLFKKYVSYSDSPFSEVFLYNGKTYSYYMFGYYDAGPDVTENWLFVKTRERQIRIEPYKTNFVEYDLCMFDYHPIN